MSQPKIKDAVQLLTATALPTTYGAWTSAEFPTAGLDRLKLLVVLSSSYDGASVEVKGQIVEPAGTFYDEHKLSDGTLDEVALVVTADGNYAIDYDCTAFDRVRFLAKRTGGTTGDAALSVLGG